MVILCFYNRLQQIAFNLQPQHFIEILTITIFLIPLSKMFLEAFCKLRTQLGKALLEKQRGN